MSVSMSDSGEEVEVKVRAEERVMGEETVEK